MNIKCYIRKGWFLLGKKYTDEFLLNELKRFYDENGRSPKKEDLNNNKDYPNSTHYQRKFGGMGNSLKLAGLQPNTYHGISKEEMINIVHNFYSKYNRIPDLNELPFSNTSIYKYFKHYIELIKCCGYKVKESGLRKHYTKEDLLNYMDSYVKLLGKSPQKKDFEVHSFEPGLWYYYKEFNGIENCLIELGYLEPKLTKEERIKLSIAKLQKLANNLNRCPTVIEYDNIDGAFARRVLERHLGMSYTDICKKYIPEYELNIIIKPENQLLKELEDLKNRLGRTPYKYELTKENNVSGENAYSNVFKLTYNQLIESLGWELSGHKFTLKTNDELLQDYYNLFIELKRIPYSDEIDNDLNMGSYSLYLRRFGSLKNVCDLLNIDFEKNYVPINCGIICFDLWNRKCLSKSEQIISNYLIKNNINNKKEYMYKYVIKKGNDSRRLDWLIIDDNNNEYYVEYFGLWGSSKNKRYNKKAKKKMKDLYNAGLINNCIFIFPRDLSNKRLGEIFKPILKLNNSISA